MIAALAEYWANHQDHFRALATNELELRRHGRDIRSAEDFFKDVLRIAGKALLTDPYCKDVAVVALQVGDCQGDLYGLFVIDKYPRRLFAASMSYGSCEGCDAYLACLDYLYPKTPDDAKKDAKRVKDLMNLAKDILVTVKEIK